MTKDEFIERYAKNSGISREDLETTHVALPCECGTEMCHGWAMVQNDQLSVQTHLDLYGPPT